MTQIVTVQPESPLLDQVKSLWRVNSRTLGFYTAGAFDERAKKGQILAAVNHDNILGYLIYYKLLCTRIRLTHLCVTPESRGAGIARQLINELRRRSNGCKGIGLHCRRDFPAWALWPKLGFSAIATKTGRSAEGHELTFFWAELPHRTLFSDIKDEDENRLRVVLDANVFYDLYSPDRKEAEESIGLIADWLQPSIQLCVSPEIFNEIQNNEVPNEREVRLRFAKSFVPVSAENEVFEQACSQIQSICGSPKTSQDAADQRQLAWTISSGAEVFVTRDQSLLKQSNEIYRVHGVSVERPSSVISRFEEIRNEHAYKSTKLIGTGIRVSRKTAGANELAQIFFTPRYGEKKHELERLLNLAFAHPDTFECKVVSSSTGTPICLYLLEAKSPANKDLRAFRFSHCSPRTRLEDSLTRTLLATLIQEVAKESSCCLHISDIHLATELHPILHEYGFFKSRFGHSKLCVNGVWQAQDIRSVLEGLGVSGEIGQADMAQVIERCDPATLKADATATLELENLIAPGKISGTCVQNYVIPIRAEWAADLFDGRLSEGLLWNADASLVLNPNSVYYRHVRPRVVNSSGRILWYISESTFTGSKMIRACSHLNDVQISGPKQLFAKFRRYGVFEWRNILEIAGSLDGKLMAIEFSNTELLRQPISWERIQEILRSQGKKNYSFPSPVKIDDSTFFLLYQEGASSILKPIKAEDAVPFNPTEICTADL